ncbi:MAG: DUF2071 domain-containing protein [Acidimicrobiia bacterium]|nr:DUF2071 domain-containing protein [Acidimicrobiia bacterium]
MTAGIEREGLFAAACPEAPARGSITVGWRSVGFVHWAYDPDVVARLLPPSVGVDLYGGRAWAGYQFLTVAPGRLRHRDSRLDRLPRLPHVRLRPEVAEVRAVVAVVDRVGRPGLWLLSVDTNRRLVAAGFRRWLNLSAYEAESRFSSAGDRIEYWTHRPDGTTARLKLARGPETAPTDVERFLTARWRIFLPPRWWDAPDEIRTITTVHEPWVLHRASVEFFDDEVLIAAGLPPSVGPGQALWSPGTSVELSRPQGE